MGCNTSSERILRMQANVKNKGVHRRHDLFAYNQLKKQNNIRNQTNSQATRDTAKTNS